MFGSRLISSSLGVAAAVAHPSLAVSMRTICLAAVLLRTPSVGNRCRTATNGACISVSIRGQTCCPHTASFSTAANTVSSSSSSSSSSSPPLPPPPPPPPPSSSSSSSSVGSRLINSNRGGHVGPPQPRKKRLPGGALAAKPNLEKDFGGVIDEPRNEFAAKGLSAANSLECAVMLLADLPSELIVFGPHDNPLDHLSSLRTSSSSSGGVGAAAAAHRRLPRFKVGDTLTAMVIDFVDADEPSSSSSSPLPPVGEESEGGDIAAIGNGTATTTALQQHRAVVVRQKRKPGAKGKGAGITFRWVQQQQQQPKHNDSRSTVMRPKFGTNFTPKHSGKYRCEAVYIKGDRKVTRRCIFLVEDQSPFTQWIESTASEADATAVALSNEVELVARLMACKTYAAFREASHEFLRSHMTVVKADDWFETQLQWVRARLELLNYPESERKTHVSNSAKIFPDPFWQRHHFTEKLHLAHSHLPHTKPLIQQFDLVVLYHLLHEFPTISLREQIASYDLVTETKRRCGLVQRVVDGLRRECEMEPTHKSAAASSESQMPQETTKTTTAAAAELWEADWTDAGRKDVHFLRAVLELAAEAGDVLLTTFVFELKQSASSNPEPTTTGNGTAGLVESLAYVDHELSRQAFVSWKSLSNAAFRNRFDLPLAVHQYPAYALLEKAPKEPKSGLSHEAEQTKIENYYHACEALDVDKFLSHHFSEKKQRHVGDIKF